MNLFNRIVIVVLLIVLLATTLLSLLVPRTVLDILRAGVDQIEATIPFYNIFSGIYWAYLGGGLGVVLLCLLLLWLELRRPQRKAVEVPGTEGRRMEVSVKSIAQQLQNRLSGVADVSRVRPRVVSRGKSVDVFLDMQVHPAVELPSKTEEVSQLSREIIEQQMGVKVGKVRVNMQYGPGVPWAGPEPESLPLVVPGEPVQPAADAELAPPVRTDGAQEEDEDWPLEAATELDAEIEIEEEEAELLAASSAVPEASENL
ncbi:MAG: alkaline shock response membrane anchor protein AmaP [Chloroflexi bacterium]|nr:alkaline shock response membrane anchor protein AmaP [Chloroflexota bacterium]